MMVGFNKFILSGVAAISAACVAATDLSQSEIRPPTYMQSEGQAHFTSRVAEIANFEPQSNGILMIGDSITEGWQSHDDAFGDRVIRNHGVGWDTSTGLLNRLPQLTQGNPDVIFLMIGTNDISYGRASTTIASEVREVISRLERAHPETPIYLQSVLPRESDAMSSVMSLNILYSTLSEQYKQVTFLDIFDEFSNGNGQLRADLTNDGLHLNAKGYEVWADVLKPYLP